MCYTRLAGNRGRKNDAENRHLSTIAQLCRAISSQRIRGFSGDALDKSTFYITLQLRHASTIGKKLVKHQYLLHMFP